MRVIQFVRLSASILLLAPLTTLCQNSNAPSGYIPSGRMHELLRKPDGLKRLSQEYGNVVIESPTERWGENDLEKLVHNSDLVVRGNLISKASFLSSDGDTIFTRYQVVTQDTLKGVAPGQLSFEESGGTVTLPTGYVVTVNSPLSNALDPAGEYIFFLKLEGGRYRLTGSIQGALVVTGEPARVHLVDRDLAQSVKLRQEVDSKDAESVTSLIREAH